MIKEKPPEIIYVLLDVQVLLTKENTILARKHI